MTTEDRRAFREDARDILRAFLTGYFTEDETLDHLGFGEPIPDTGPWVRGANG